MMHDVGVLLLSVVAGYWVLERSSSHKGELQRVGRLLGTVVIAVSLIGLGYAIANVAAYSMSYCPMGKSAMTGRYCPFTKMAPRASFSTPSMKPNRPQGR